MDATRTWQPLPGPVPSDSIRIEASSIEFVQQTTAEMQNNYGQRITGHSLILASSRSRRTGPYNLAGKSAVGTISEVLWHYSTPQGNYVNHHRKQHYECANGEDGWCYRMYFRFAYDHPPRILDIRGDDGGIAAKLGITHTLLVSAYQGNSLINQYPLNQDQRRSYPLPPELLVDDLYFDYQVVDEPRPLRTVLPIGETYWGVGGPKSETLDPDRRICGYPKYPESSSILDFLKCSFLTELHEV